MLSDQAHPNSLLLFPFFFSPLLSRSLADKRPWRSLTKQELEKILLETPPVWRGSSKLFRNLRERGIISYTEYLFLLCILTSESAQSFHLTSSSTFLF
ncbi:calcium uptake protein 3, mitochondrial-like protein [Lates japonicus]|uniref:Calcium uptake protein 3, mitochondrial-like protein n=1 Tax=Lates japonicus TaxID=270547 RepID=A0AAD3R1Y3_LATJO|nr:calcium uptake protein 3, mitochondrial-like protein [Lates japonicus]